MNNRNPFGYTDTDMEDFRYVRRKTVKWGIIALVAVMLISFGSFWLNQWWRRTKAPIEGETAQIELTEGNANFRIAAYEWFYDQCAAIQAAEDRIGIQESELATATDSRANQINTNLVALRNQRASLVREYNQEVRKEDTTGQFRASGLPTYIQPEAVRTSCGE